MEAVFFSFLVTVGRSQMMLSPHPLTGSITEAAYFFIIIIYVFI